MAPQFAASYFFQAKVGKASGTAKLGQCHCRCADELTFLDSSFMHSLADLIDRDEPAWPLVQQWIAEAAVTIEVLPVDPKDADAALLATQVTTRSPMGAIVHNSAGIFIDHGWLRLLAAGGHQRFKRSLPEWNDGKSNRFYLVADDVLGGFFAINGGRFGDDAGKIYYFAPDALQWEACDLNYSEFVVWAMSDRIHAFYDASRWKDWVVESREVSGDEALCVYPFLWADGPPIGERRRSLVPVAESWSLQLDLKKQLDAESGRAGQ